MMLKKGDIVYKITLDGQRGEVRSVGVEKYKIRQRVSSKTDEGEIDSGYKLEHVLRDGECLYLGDYMPEFEETRIKCGIISYRNDFIFVLDEKDIPAARMRIIKNNIDFLQSELSVLRTLYDLEKSKIKERKENNA